MKWWIALLVLGVLLLAPGSGVGRSSSGSGQVMCGSKAMVPGDVCEETRRGVVTDTYTYAEKAREQKEDAEAFSRSGRWVLLGTGIGLILIATVGIVGTKRRRARQPPTTADLHLRQQAAWQQNAQPAHTWQPPRQPYPQQPYPPRQHNQPPPQQYPDFGPRG